ncbi:MAG: hypothetical protein J0L62_08090 [Bacteroidetes bacterium]|nr:hypothetical protein [Bacteroidota bacterium]
MAGTSFGQSMTSGTKIIHVQEARTPKEGTLTFYNNMSAFGKSAGAGGTVWDVRNAINLDYSFTDNILLAANATLYQDLNDGSSDANTPVHDFSLTLKAGSFGFNADQFQLGGLLNINIPVGESTSHNIPFSIYNGMGLGITYSGFISYYGDNLFPDESYSLHLNLGFANYFAKNNEGASPRHVGGEKDTSGVFTLKNNPFEFKYGVGAKYPFSYIDLYGEVWGNVFIKEPDQFVFGRESYTYLTVGIGAKPLDLLKLDISFDLLANGSKNTSKYKLLSTGELLEMTTGGIKDVNYAPWRLNVGFKVNILPFKTTYAIDPSRRYEISEREANEIRSRVRIIEEDEAVTRDKVETLKVKRKDVETNLKQLRDLLKQLDTNQDNN